VINVVKILVHIVRDIAKNNKDTLAEQLVDIMKDILPQLSVPGKEEAEFSVDALNGNDSIIFLNRFDEIVGRMLGVCATKVLDDDD
jgi:signal recognition particle GTPase